ncbi:hypothetical protein ES703_11270 [subsurface metagenome]
MIQIKKIFMKKKIKVMAKNLSQATKDRISTGQKDAWRDPTKRIEQKKRIEAKRLLKGAVPDQVESPSPLNIENAQQAPIDEIKKSDDRCWEILLNNFMEYFFIRQRRPLRESLNILEKAILIKVLSSVNCNQKDAAKFLGIKYTTLHEKIKKYNIKFFKSPIEG